MVGVDHFEARDGSVGPNHVTGRGAGLRSKEAPNLGSKVSIREEATGYMIGFTLPTL